MSLLKRIYPRLVAEVKSQTATESAQPDYGGMVRRILTGDTNAEAKLVECFRHGIFQIILNIVRDPPLAEDLSQDALIKIIKKIRNGDLQHPEKLKYFVLSVAKFHAIGQIRTIRRRSFSEDLEEAEQ